MAGNRDNSAFMHDNEMLCQKNPLLKWQYLTIFNNCCNGALNSGFLLIKT
jgi:hypothetical protein